MENACSVGVTRERTMFIYYMYTNIRRDKQGGKERGKTKNGIIVRRCLLSVRCRMRAKSPAWKRKKTPMHHSNNAHCDETRFLFLPFFFTLFFFSIVHRTCFLSPVCDTQADTSRRKMTDRVKENERDRERSYEDEEKYSIYNLYYLIRV